MRGLAVESVLAATSAEPSAKLSFRRPHRPLGSAAEIFVAIKSERGGNAPDHVGS